MGRMGVFDHILACTHIHIKAWHFNLVADFILFFLLVSTQLCGKIFLPLTEHDSKIHVFWDILRFVI